MLQIYVFDYLISADELLAKALQIIVFDYLISADELLAKALQIIATCISVSNNLCGKLVSSLELPIRFDINLKIRGNFKIVELFVTNFNLSSCEFFNLTVISLF